MAWRSVRKIRGRLSCARRAGHDYDSWERDRYLVMFARMNNKHVDEQRWRGIRCDSHGRWCKFVDLHFFGLWNASCAPKFDGLDKLFAIDSRLAGVYFKPDISQHLRGSSHEFFPARYGTLGPPAPRQSGLWERETESS